MIRIKQTNGIYIYFEPSEIKLMEQKSKLTYIQLKTGATIITNKKAYELYKQIK